MNHDFAGVAPDSAPRNVRARPVSSNTVVVQWDEPSLSNGVIRVPNSSLLITVTITIISGVASVLRALVQRYVMGPLVTKQLRNSFVFCQFTRW